ncbi:hypothetical protein D3C87_105610 [compost metagenome]
MIVPSMTIQNIHKELYSDLENIRAKLDFYNKDFGRKVLKASRHPFSHIYEYRTKEKKNLFVITFTSLKRSAWKKPILSIYSRPEGNYVAAPLIELGETSIFLPHFFKRYRERIVKDDTISNIDIIKRYFKNEWGFMGAIVDEEFKAVYHSFENDNKEDKVSFVGAVAEGYFFGERQGHINVFKTIISEEMLFDNQKKLFLILREDFIRKNKEKYSVEL